MHLSWLTAPVCRQWLCKAYRHSELRTQHSSTRNSREERFRPNHLKESKSLGGLKTGSWSNLAPIFIPQEVELLISGYRDCHLPRSSLQCSTWLSHLHPAPPAPRHLASTRCKCLRAGSGFIACHVLIRSRVAGRERNVTARLHLFDILQTIARVSGISAT